MKIGISEYIKKNIALNPVKSILIIALLVRLAAAVFSKGYMMHDDHFLVIEAAQSWANGDDYNNWLPWNQTHPQPQGHSFFYVGIHYVLFIGFSWLSIDDPQIKMLIIRIIHAFFSLLIVYYSYKMVRKISDEKNAVTAALIMALAWFMPVFSVRNLVEIVAIPFLMQGIWLLMRDEKPTFSAAFFAGFVLGLAFSVRFQTLIFTGGAGLALLWQKQYKAMFVTALGTLVSIGLVQGLIDFAVWGRPFAELWAYIEYNWTHKNDYGVNNQLMYISILTVVYSLPLGAMLLFGFFRSWKKYVLIFLPTFLFWLFHNIFPNKQERFIFTILPLFFVLGFVGWTEFIEKPELKNKFKKLTNFSFKFFWILNIPLLLLFTFSSNKRSRMESMAYFYGKDKIIVLSEDTNHTNAAMLPFYYQGKQGFQYILPRCENPDTIPPDYSEKGSKYVSYIYKPEFFNTCAKDSMPDYVFFLGDENLDSRVERMKSVFPKLSPEAEIRNSATDFVFQTLNPINKNFRYYIYKTSAREKEKPF